MDKDRKSQLKMQYKQTPRPMGVYQIKNLVNGKIFIDSSPNLDGTKNSFYFQLTTGCHRNKELQKEWQEFGENNFSFEILEQIKPKEDLKYDYKEDLEILKEIWLDKIQPYGEKGYNKIK